MWCDYVLGKFSFNRLTLKTTTLAWHEHGKSKVSQCRRICVSAFEILGLTRFIAKTKVTKVKTIELEMMILGCWKWHDVWSGEKTIATTKLNIDLASGQRERDWTKEQCLYRIIGKHSKRMKCRVSRVQQFEKDGQHYCNRIKRKIRTIWRKHNRIAA